MYVHAADARPIVISRRIITDIIGVIPFIFLTSLILLELGSV
jgi:hypothetical protein